MTPPVPMVTPPLPTEYHVNNVVVVVDQGKQCKQSAGVYSGTPRSTGSIFTQSRHW